jgi:hypothetical protein
MNLFWKEMGEKGPIKSTIEGGDDAEFEISADKYFVLFRIPETGNPQQIIGKIQQSMIETKVHVMITSSLLVLLRIRRSFRNLHLDRQRIWQKLTRRRARIC